MGFFFCHEERICENVKTFLLYVPYKTLDLKVNAAHLDNEA